MLHSWLTNDNFLGALTNHNVLIYSNDATSRFNNIIQHHGRKFRKYDIINSNGKMGRLSNGSK